MILNEMVEMLRRERPVLRGRHHVRSLAVFGSAVRGETTAGSDFDILVEFHKSPGLFGFVELERYLSSLLGVDVDLVEKKSLKPRIAERVLKEAMAI